MPPERKGRRLDTASEHAATEVVVEAFEALNVNRMLVDPQNLHDGFLSCPTQRKEKRLVRVGQHIVRISGIAADHDGQTVALGIRGDDTESARPSAARKKTTFIISTYCATDSLATALSG
jgi:uncharacterized Zn-binding protein involved in type VI secretion